MHLPPCTNTASACQHDQNQHARNRSDGAGRLAKGPKPELMSEGLDHGMLSQICALHRPVTRPGKDPHQASQVSGTCSFLLLIMFPCVTSLWILMHLAWEGEKEGGRGWGGQGHALLLPLIHLHLAKGIHGCAYVWLLVWSQSLVMQALATRFHVLGSLCQQYSFAVSPCLL